MALGTIAGALATSAASFGLSKLFGGKKKTSPIADFKTANIDAGGLSSRLSGGTVGVTSSPERQELVGRLSRTFPEQAQQVAGLRGQLDETFGSLTSSRLAEIESARQRSVGNLRENLQRRRVLGSSFAGDALARTEAEFAQQSERVQAESALQKLDISRQLIDQEFNIRRGEFQTNLDDLNLQADIATKLASGATSQLGANARLKAELDAKEAQASGSFFGQTFQPVIDAIGSSVTGLFGPSTALA